MVEINLGNYNEMLRYERDMDLLRALALWITTFDGARPIPSLPNPREYVFGLIKMYSEKFAVDIKDEGRILPETISLFHSALTTICLILGISGEDILLAGEKQRYVNSGFWEMRRVIGQFRDMAEEVIKNDVSLIITAGISGCVIGEYLGLFVRELGRTIPVEHMIFSRNGIDPDKGYLRENFSMAGGRVLIVDDAVMEAVTLAVMVEKIRAICPSAELSLLAVDISPEVMSSGYLSQFSHLYLFEE